MDRGRCVVCVVEVVDGGYVGGIVDLFGLL